MFDFSYYIDVIKLDISFVMTLCMYVYIYMVYERCCLYFHGQVIAFNAFRSSNPLHTLGILDNRLMKPYVRNTSVDRALIIHFQFIPSFILTSIYLPNITIFKIIN